MNILLTGANGFVGINILNEIITNTNWNITCLINKNEEKIPKHIKKIYDLSTNFCFDVIIHAGGNPSSKSCIENPSSAMNDNIFFTFNLLEYARKNKCLKFIFLSGCEVYGFSSSDSSEKDVLISRNMYGASKVSGEHLCSAYYYSYGISSICIRLLNTYGPYCQQERFPSIIKKKFETEENPHFILTSKATKRWLEITEMANRIIFIIKHMEEGFDIFNLVGDEDLSLEDFIKKLSCGKEFTFEYQIDDKKGYNPDYNANGKKFNEFKNKIKLNNNYI